MNKSLYIITISLLVIALSILMVKVIANPIPVPTLILEKELIEISIKKFDTDLYVCVHGTYPFTNMGYNNITMYFPVPREAVENGKIEILVDGKRVEWCVVEEGVLAVGEKLKKFKYITVEGMYPLLKWRIRDVPKKFTVEVKYSYVVKLSTDNSYHILYAMATGRFSSSYAKRCTAYVTLRLYKLSDSLITISLVPSPEVITSGTSGKTQFIQKITSDYEILKIVEESRMFHGLDRDLLIVLKPSNETVHTTIPQHTWIPSKPSSAEIKPVVESNAHTFLEIILTFRHGGFRVEWGPAKVLDNEINIYVEVQEWTGPSIQVITQKKHTYDLGVLNPGTYIAKLYINGELFSERIFQVQGLDTGSITTTAMSNTSTTYLKEQELNIMKYLFIGLGAAGLAVIVIIIKILKLC